MILANEATINPFITVFSKLQPARLKPWVRRHRQEEGREAVTSLRNGAWSSARTKSGSKSSRCAASDRAWFGMAWLEEWAYGVWGLVGDSQNIVTGPSWACVEHSRENDVRKNDTLYDSMGRGHLKI